MAKPRKPGRATRKVAVRLTRMDDQAAPQAPPVAGTGKPLFILDARHGVEERYLREWLRGRGNTDASAASSDCVVLPISVEGRALSLERLDSMLAAAR